MKDFIRILVGNYLLTNNDVKNEKESIYILAVRCLPCRYSIRQGVQAQEKKDSLVNVAFGTVAQEDLTNAISTVSTSELMKKVNSSNSLGGAGELGRWIYW